MNKSDRIGWLGCGEMGSMVLNAALDGGKLTVDQILIAERDAQIRAALAARGLHVTDHPHALEVCEVLLLAVRPQDFSAAVTSLVDSSRPRLVISLMAGIPASRIQTALGVGTRVVGVMPNAPVQIGHGLSVIMPSPGVTASDIDFVTMLFGELGETLILEESDLWAATAVSGSGPGFILLMASALHEVALDLGLEPATAQQLIGQSLVGTGRLLLDTGETASALRSRVTTPGGTTAAGLEEMRKGGLVEAIKAGVRAAHERGATLAGE